MKQKFLGLGLVTAISGCGLLLSLAGDAAAALPAQILDGDAKPTAVKVGLGLCDSPTVDGKGNLFFLDRSSGDIWKLTDKGDVVKDQTKIEGARSIAVEKAGGFVAGLPKRFAHHAPGEAERILVGGDIIGLVEDISVGKSGAMFLSNGTSGNSVFYRTAEGGRIAQRGVKGGVGGLAYVDEKSTLYASQPTESKVLAFDTSNEGFLGVNAKTAVPKVSDPAGLTIDELGDLYVASPKERAVFVFAPDGKEIGKIELPSEAGKPAPAPTNVIFAGPDVKTLFITADGGLWKLPLKVVGLSR